MTSKILLAIFATMALAACSTAGPSSSDDKPVDKNSPVYEQGYQDGCAAVNPRYRKDSGHEGPPRDDKLYENDSNYRGGWDTGFRKCEDKVDQGGLPIPGNSVIM